MSGASRRALWGPFSGRPQHAPPVSITEAIESLTDQVIAVRVLKEKGMPAETQQSSTAPAPASTPLPAPPEIAPASAPSPSAPAAGSFAASIRAMVDEARDGVAQARADGLAVVKEAIGKLDEAKQATAKVASNIAKQAHDEAASVMAELGQISNDL